MPGDVRFRLSSALAVEADGRTLTGRDLGSRKARTLLALLAAERGRGVPLDRIVAVLWPDGPPSDPPANVATLVSRSRRLLGDRVVTGSGRAYGLGDGGGWSVDLDEASAFVVEAEARLAAHELGLAAAAARRAVDLLGEATPLVDEGDDEWVLAVRREVEASRRRARHALVTALLTGSPAEAVEVAEQAVAADEFDERAVRDLMRACVAAGRPAAALSAFDALAARLRHELGTDPGSETAALHLEVLRDSLTEPERPASARGGARGTLVGREAELAVLERAWSDAAAGTGGLVLVEGEGGIGKTRLLEAAAALADRTGGLVLTTRCHPTERSLFLEPYVEALRPVLLEMTDTRLATVVRDHEDAWSALLPEVAPLLPPRPHRRAVGAGPAELQRRRAYDAVAAVLRRLADDRPVLLSVDDLQDGGAATVDLLGHLGGRLRAARVLLLAAVRTEAVRTVSLLRDRALLVPLGPLPRSAVDALAAAAGLATQGAAVMQRTGGHALSVVESLRALASGEGGVPASLAEAVRARVDRLEPAAQEVLLAASVLRRRLDPQLLADLTGTTEVRAVSMCETLAGARLLTRNGRHYEFANDLLQECVAASLPPALATAYHRRAADLTTDRPEVMAEHALAAGDDERAAQGWLLAGDAAMRRSAVADAAALYGRGLAAASQPALRSRLLLARSGTGEARATYADALADIDEALALAREAGDRRLEMAALRARGGDVPIGLHAPTDDVARHLQAALEIAGELGDRPAEADVSARLCVLDVSRLRFAPAIDRAEATLRRVGNHDQATRVLALDGLKTAWAYLGAADRLEEILAEVEPVLRRRESSWLLQWVVFESSFVSAAHGRWDECADRVAEAAELNRRTGYTAYAGFFEAHQGWFDRLAGDLDGAVRHGQRAVELTSAADHPWWYAAACGQLAATLVEVGDPTAAEAAARRGLAATGPGTAEAWRLRCAAPLAAVSDDEADWRLALDLVRAIDAPPGHAWVVGADCYLLVGRAALRHGAVGEVVEPLLSLRRATETSWRPVRRAVDEVLAQTSSASS